MVFVMGKAGGRDVRDRRDHAVRHQLVMQSAAARFRSPRRRRFRRHRTPSAPDACRGRSAKFPVPRRHASCCRGTCVIAWRISCSSTCSTALLTRICSPAARGCGATGTPTAGSATPAGSVSAPSASIMPKSLWLDQVRLAEDRGALDRVHQLAHVARPALALKELEGLVGKLLRRAGHGARRTASSARSASSGMSSSRSRSGRQPDGDAADAVEQVEAEGAVGDHRLEVAVAGADQPEVGTAQRRCRPPAGRCRPAGRAAASPARRPACRPPRRRTGVPPSACSILPLRPLRSAPVKEPAS